VREKIYGQVEQMNAAPSNSKNANSMGAAPSVGGRRRRSRKHRGSKRRTNRNNMRNKNRTNRNKNRKNRSNRNRK
jgi:hypothetical protein